VSGKKVKGQGHMDPLKYRIGGALFRFILHDVTKLAVIENIKYLHNSSFLQNCHKSYFWQSVNTN